MHVFLVNEKGKASDELFFAQEIKEVDDITESRSAVSKYLFKATISSIFDVLLSDFVTIVFS